MSELGFHLMCRLQDSRVIAPTADGRLFVSRVVLQQGRRHRLLAFNLADTHLHLEVAESRRACKELARRIEIAITCGLRPGVGFSPVHVKPIRDQAHLSHAFDYVFRQQAHHGLTSDPYREGSNLPDLLGMRVLGTFTARHVHELLPRVRRSQLLAYLQLESLNPADGSLDKLGEATCAAIGLTQLKGHSTLVRAARVAAIAIADQSLTTGRLATALGTHRDTVRRLRRARPSPELQGAIRLQLALRTERATESAGGLDE